MSQFKVDVGNSVVQRSDIIVGNITVELNYTLHLDFHEAQNVVASDFAVERRLKGSQTAIDVRHGFIDITALLILAVLVDSFFDENLLKRKATMPYPRCA